jgi:hypothetical protein
MIRKLGLFVIVACSLALGCAGPSKLAERSGDKLDKGEMWAAWRLATQALDKAPGHSEARAAADAAAAAIAADWQRRIRATASVDSLAAADEVLEFVGFRTDAIPYTTVQVGSDWILVEHALRSCAAREHYRAGADALATRRPKRAYGHFVEAERFVPGYRDAAALAERAYDRAVTRVAFVPLRTAASGPVLGREVAASWRGDVVEAMTPPGTYFTRILSSDDIERAMTVADMGRLTRDDAVRIGRGAGADRVVWGSIGAIDSKSGIQYFSDVVYRRVVEKNSDGTKTTRWAAVPIEVIARVRTVNVDLEHEVIAAKGGTTLARQRGTRTMKARVVWTAYMPEGAPDTYSLVTEETRESDPDRAKAVEAKWSAVVGEGTSLVQVLEARRAGSKPSKADVLGRIMAGAAFVFLEELPSTEELAFGALAGGWKPVCDDLVRLDAVDDPDLGVTTTASGGGR